MSQIPSEFKYSETHEWVQKNDDGTLTIGITDHAQSLLGDLVFVELPEINSSITVGEEGGVVESVKAASDIYSPISGKIVAVNEELLDNPALVNTDPYGGGWLYKIQPLDIKELDDLLTAAEYESSITEDEEEFA